MPRPFRAILAQEGVETNEGMLHRRFDNFTWREPPLTLMAQLMTDEGHDGAEVAGRIDAISKDASGLVVATGVLDDEGDDAARIVHLVAERMLNKISVDPGSVVVEEEIRATDDDGFPTDVLLRFTEYEIGAATIVNVPAIDGTLIELTDGAEEVDVEEPEDEDEPVAASGSGLAAGTARPASAATAGGGIPLPPADWFTDPGLDGPTPITVTPEGRVFGTLAAWGTCHIGRNDICLEPPASAAGYAHFLTSSSRVRTAAGPETIRTGRLTAGIGHADISLDARSAAAHYDNSDTAWAEVAAGEDAHGIWVAGAVLPDVDELTLRRVSGLAISGDWRRIGGNLELVAALSVNVPGFPIRAVAASAGSVPRVRLDSDGCAALVAAGQVRPVTEVETLRAEVAELSARLDGVERVTKPLSPVAAERLRAQIAAG